MYQTTIKRSVHCEGIGLHSGKNVRLSLHPTGENTGIVFKVVLPTGEKTLALEPRAVIATELATTLGERDTTGNTACGVRVSTIEHLLAAVRALNIDNLLVEVGGFELPVLDGSAAPFVRMIREAGIQSQHSARHSLRIKRQVHIEDGAKYIVAHPHDGFFVDYTIDFPHPVIGRQRLALEITPQTFSEIASARTFGFLPQIEELHKRGLALGGSLENAVALDEQGVLNPEGLRFPDEFVRHKLLDFVGDMAMLGLPLQGRFTVHCSGHALNNQFLRMLTEKDADMLVSICSGAAVPFAEDERSSECSEESEGLMASAV